MLVLTKSATTRYLLVSTALCLTAYELETVSMNFWPLVILNFVRMVHTSFAHRIK
jgi:hypothetical protein